MPSPGPSLPLQPQGQRRTPPQSRRLHGWVNTRSGIPSTPRQSMEKAMKKQVAKKTPKNSPP